MTGSKRKRKCKKDIRMRKHHWRCDKKRMKQEIRRLNSERYNNETEYNNDGN